MVLGIDLGTCNSVAATLTRDGSAVLIPDSVNREEVTTPSVAIIDGKKAYAGLFAENLFETFPDKELISFFKRYFGTQEPVYVDENKNAWFSETLAALILRKIKYDAEMYMPDGYRKAVITVPAHYNDAQRKSAIEASRLAGLELNALVEEPVAAALFYSSQNAKLDDEIILVYDFGGGTFDLTLITKSGNQLHVIAKDGISNVGGKEFDEIVSNRIRQTYEDIMKQPFPSDKLSLNRLRKISEVIKIRLNQQEGGQDLAQWLIFGHHAFECVFDFRAYASEAVALIQKTENAVLRCLKSLGMQWSDVSKVILIGGTSNSKLIYNYWNQKINPEKQTLIYHQPLTSVAKGAAIYAGSLSDGAQQIGSAVELKTVSTYNIGLRQKGGKQIDLLIHRNTPLPISAKRVYRIDPNVHEHFSMDLCQFWDAETEVFYLGEIKAGPFSHQATEFYLEFAIENRSNGTIGIKVKNADNGKDIKFEFIKKQTKHTYDFHKQKALVDSVYLNNYV
ncbi:Hsp70 family protein [Chitinophagaceae bacterium LB-8]|uniref:Hsp70 family protein n=1 Tax=Paraflavisolibacter caeni TaxID=2982496 RepID=A0A9X3BJM9_9BACT|nr:Hsp70 family protein [Paraflavisolibacter caeni]MCU7551423.1 Hsp70 family protein [Paraflavisolibacter caeni]